MPIISIKKGLAGDEGIFSEQIWEGNYIW